MDTLIDFGLNSKKSTPDACIRSEKFKNKDCSDSDLLLNRDKIDSRFINKCKGKKDCNFYFPPPALK
jgi:hypothetical protein